MIDSLTLRYAKPSDANEMSELAVRSKAFWGYSKEFMDACREELAVTEKSISSDNTHYLVAEKDSKLLGYYAIEKCSDKEYELEALFVEPNYIGKGIGKLLMSHAIDKVTSLDGNTLIIQGDPNAEKFYLAAGAIRIGDRESASIAGRSLPLFKIDIATKP